jgi:hypothetical protein
MAISGVAYIREEWKYRGKVHRSCVCRTWRDVGHGDASYHGHLAHLGLSKRYCPTPAL